MTTPTKPWLARRDWKRRRVAQTRYSLYAWAVAAGAGAMALIGLYLDRGPGWFLLPLVFAFVAVIAVVAGVYLTIRELKFGSGILELGRVPYFTGEPFAATLEVRNVPVNAVFKCTLQAIHKMHTGSGKYAKVVHVTLWEETRIVTGAPSADGGLRLSMSFDLPAGQPGTSRSPGERIYWELNTTAEAGTVDLNMSHELPVFSRE